MAYPGTPTIPRGEEHFFNLVYTGTSTGQTIGRFLPFTNNGTISKSLIFEDGDSAYLSRTHSASNKKTFTFSAWIKRGNVGSYQRIFNASDAGDNEHFIFRDTNVLHFYSGDATIDVKTTRTFEDVSKWYHIVLRVDTTQATASNRVRIYVDGEEITALATATYPSQDADTAFNGNVAHDIGRSNASGGSQYFDGYMAEVNFADGQSYGPDTFGLTDTSTGQWIPKSLSGITYGTNGFRLTFANSAGQTIGDDTSGNGNDFSVNNLATTALSINTPTKNFPVVDIGSANSSASFTTANGNMIITSPAGTTAGVARLTMRLPKSGKWIVPFKLRSPVGAQTVNSYRNEATGSIFFADKGSFESTFYANDHESAYGMFVMGGLGSSNPQYPGTASIIAGTQGSTVNQTNNMGSGYHHWAIDIDNQKAWLYLYDGSGAGTSGYMNGPNDNSSFDGDPAAGTGETLSIPFKDTRFDYYIGVEDSSASANYYIDWAMDMTTTENVPTATINAGFKNISQDEFPASPDSKGTPDLAWFKARDATNNHLIVDSSRGGNKQLQPNLDNGELTQEDMIQKFLPGGYFVEDFVNLNENETPFVSWNWVANGGTTAANTDGSGASIASTTQANQTAGFSIVTYTGTGSSGTVAHGLSEAPEWMLIKERGNTNGWIVSHAGFTSQGTRSLNLIDGNAEYSDAGTYYWNNAAPTNKVFSIATDSAVNRSSGTYVAYCWHSVPGFSRFSHYFGNGSVGANTFVYTGFKPSWILFRATDAEPWYIWDNARNPINMNQTVNNLLRTNNAGGDVNETGGGVLAMSNGFKVIGDSGWHGTNAQRYIYCAFAEHPWIGDGTSPVPAK